jgi:nucleotide-binding universal stress UspA family protein
MRTPPAKEKGMTTSPTAPIVVGVDGSLRSMYAADWATREAVARRCPLHIVHAFLWPLLNVPIGPPDGGPPDAGLRNAGERILAAAADRARQVGPALEISTDLPVCSPAAALVEASHGARLVAVGHRGLGGFTGLLVGSVGVQTAAHADCPVVVRSSDAAEPASAVGPVVVEVDGSPLSGLAIDFAFSHAALHGLGVVALHVHQRPEFTVPADQPLPGPDGEDRRDYETRLLTDALAGYNEKYPEVPVRRKIVMGRPSGVLVAQSAVAALTVVGSRGRGGFPGLLLGSTSQTVLQHAAGPVAVVRARSARGRDHATARGDEQIDLVDDNDDQQTPSSGRLGRAAAIAGRRG